MQEIAAQDLIRLDGKAAIVTGAAVGIGYGIAYRLAEAGARVLLADLDAAGAERAAATLRERGFAAAGCACDVADEASVAAMVASAVQACGGVDILVNNAGIYPPKPVAAMEPADFDRVIAVNLRGTYLATRAAAARMIEQGRGGRIINVTSIDALHPSMVGLAHYDASKHGMWGFTKNAALEYAPHRIWINAIAPGAIATPGVAALRGGQGATDAAATDAFLQAIPMRRMGEPDDIGRAALFLASDLSSYVTGSQLVVDGGMLLT